MNDFSISTRALTAVNALVDAARGARPTDARAVSGFVSAARQVTSMVAEVEGRPERALRNLLRSVEALDQEDRAELWVQRFEEVALAGQFLAEQLANRVNAQRKRLDDLRKTLSKTALPSDGDLKKLARYEAMLARATEAQLRIIGEMREQVKKARTGRSARKASSFSSGSSAPFRLRVVR